MFRSIVSVVLIVVGVLHVCTGVRGDERDLIIAELRHRLALTSTYIGVSQPLAPPHTIYKNQCSCEEYCTSTCFSIMCSPCAADDFSFPGGESLCLSVGPLGTGLLCHVDPVSGNLTQNACCSSEGPTCWLPQDSCCSGGGCSSCPQYHDNSSLLFPALRRTFVNDTCSDL